MRTTHSLSLEVSPLGWWHLDALVPLYPVPPNLPQYTVLNPQGFIFENLHTVPVPVSSGLYCLEESAEVEA